MIGLKCLSSFLIRIREKIFRDETTVPARSRWTLETPQLRLDTTDAELRERVLREALYVVINAPWYEKMY